MSQASIGAHVNEIHRMPEARRKVYDQVVRFSDPKIGGATCGVVAVALGWPRDSVSPRMGELRRSGLVYDTGDVLGGQTVYRAAEKPLKPDLSNRRRSRHAARVLQVTRAIVGGKWGAVATLFVPDPCDPRLSTVGAEPLLEVVR